MKILSTHQLLRNKCETMFLIEIDPRVMRVEYQSVISHG